MNHGLRKQKYLILIFLAIFTQTAYADAWGPWSLNTDAPTIRLLADREVVTIDRPEEAAQSIAATPFLWLLSFYQKAISPVISGNGRCPMHPTCSQYSVQAIHKHGPAIGIIMTADRLMHEIDEQRYVSVVRIGDRYRFNSKPGQFPHRMAGTFWPEFPLNNGLCQIRPVFS